MKVLTVTTQWPNHRQPLYGLFVRERIRALATLCDVRIVAPIPWFPPVKFAGQRYYDYSQVARHETQGTLDVSHPRYLVTPRIGVSLHGAMMYLSLFLVVKRIRAAFPFDIIDAHWAYPDGYAAIRIAERLQVPCTVTVRGSDITDFAQERGRGERIRCSLRRAARVICVSQALQNEVCALGIPAGKTLVIENGVDKQTFCAVEQSEARQRLNLPADVRIIVSVGQLRELKGFHVLIDAVRALHDNNSEVLPVFLYIVGSEPSGGSYRSVLARQIADAAARDYIALAGPQPPAMLKYWYSAADIFCLASSREGCPNVVLESLACGTPIVATAVGGIPDIISDPELGMLVERNVTSIYQAIEKALKRTWNQEKMIEHVRTHYSWENAAAKIYRVFESIIESRR